MSDNNELRANAADAAPRHSATPEPVSRLGPDGRVSAFAAFTPGPWKLEKWQTGALYVGYGRVGRDGIDGIICDWPDAGDYTLKAQAGIEANANLIAAAPELYEAAGDALELLNANIITPDALNRVGRTLEAALAKARGDAA